MLPVRTLCLFGITTSLALAGCVGGSHGNFAVGWDLAWVDNESNLLGCDEAGAAWVDLDMVDMHDQEYHDRFACSDMGGFSQTLHEGDYSVVLRVRDANENLLSATAPTWFSIFDGTTYLTDNSGNWPLMALQSFVLDWTISVGGVPASCAQAGAAWVELLTVLPTNQPVSYLFPCETYSGETQAIPTGSYTVDLQLLDANQVPLDALTQPLLNVGSSPRAYLGRVDFYVP